MCPPSASKTASDFPGVAGDELADLLDAALNSADPDAGPDAGLDAGPDDDVLVLDNAVAAEPEPEISPSVMAKFRPVIRAVATDIQINFNEPEDVLVLDDTMTVEPAPLPPVMARFRPVIHAVVTDVRIRFGGDENEGGALAEPEDVLLLDESMTVEPEPDAPDVTNEPEPEDVLVLDDALTDEPEPDDAPLTVEPDSAPPVMAGHDPAIHEPDAATDDAPDEGELAMPTEADVAQLIAAQLAAHGIAAEERGDYSLPERRDILLRLLAEPPPAQDFEALDMLYACWPKATTRSPSRALLAVALNLSSQFGRPSRLPMAASKAWRMLDADLFETDLAQLLLGFGDFILEWQRRQDHFLILEFGEIELIEYLFESLPPGRYMDLLVTVMNFKVLSNRRMGLLRRIPNRLRKQVQTMLPGQRAEALVLLAHSKALLEKLAQPPGFPPLMETASRMVEEIDKIMKQTAAAGQPAPPPQQGGGTLGKIG